MYAAYFGAYEAVKLKLTESLPNQHASVVQIASGFLAECVAVIFWNPWEVVRQRMQLGSGPDAAGRTFVQTTQDIVKESGVRGLYAGVGGYLALWGTFSPLMFVIYERGIAFAYPAPPPALGAGSSRSGASPQAVPPQVVPSLGVSFLAGSLAGIIAAAVTSPFDVVKTRMQTQTSTTLVRYTSVLHGLTEIYTHEGQRALFRGVIARSANQGLATGIMMGTYGVMRGQLARKLGWLPSEEPTLERTWADQAGPMLPVAGGHPHGGDPAARGSYSRMRLQPWPSENAAYDEGVWPAAAEPYGPLPPPSAATQKKQPQDHGFIRPLTRWD